jgi:amino acid transporter
MGNAIGQSLPMAVRVAVSPLPIIAVVIMLTTARARANGLAFLGGWLIGLGVVGAIVLFALGSSGASQSGEPATWVDWLKIVLGVLLLAVAVIEFRRRPRGHEQAAMWRRCPSG